MEVSWFLDLEVLSIVLLLLMVLVAVVAASSVWLMVLRPGMEGDRDGVFWYGFVGLCIAGPLVLMGTLANRWWGAGMLVLAAISAGIAWRYSLRRLRARAEQGQRRELVALVSALEHRHDEVLRQWGHFELDVAACIDFPGMSDVRVPETSSLAKACIKAASLRIEGQFDGGSSYAVAVAELEAAFGVALAASATPQKELEDMF